MKTILLAFANSESNRLPTLMDEYQTLNDLLREQAGENDFRVMSNPIATREYISADIQAYERSVCLFLFSGHAGKDHIYLEDGSGKVEGIAALLGRCPNLKVVILNGCSTVGQVNWLLESGVPVVIATSASVGDEKANRFSKSFFRSLFLQKGSILESFNKAMAVVKFYGSVSNNEIDIRGLGTENRDKSLWGIYYYEHNGIVANSQLLSKVETLQNSKILELIAENEIQKAIDILRSNADTMREATLVMAKYKKLERDIMLDLIPFSESIMQRAQIANVILQLAKQLN